MGGKSAKRISSFKSVSNYAKLLLFFFLWPTQKYYFEFLRFQILIIFPFSLTWVPMEQKFQNVTPLSNSFRIIPFFLEISSQWYMYMMYSQTFASFNDFFFGGGGFQIHHCTIWGNQKLKLPGKRAVAELTRLKVGVGVPVEHIWDTFDHYPLGSYFQVIQCTRLKTAWNFKMAAEQNWLQFGNRRYDKYGVYIWPFVLKVILGSFSAIVLKWPAARKRLATEQNGLEFGTRWH